MKKLLSLLTTVLLSAGAALAVPKTQYYSDCADKAWKTGCYANADLSNAACSTAGIVTNPFCPDPDGDGSVDYIMASFDGDPYAAGAPGTGKNVPDAVGDDTIVLCADDTVGHVACGGTASVVGVNCTGYFGTGNNADTAWFAPFTTGGTAGHVITIQANTATTATISGDSNQDTIYQRPAGSCSTATDVGTLILLGTDSNAVSRHAGFITWKGITFEKSGQRMTYLGLTGEGPSGWTFDGDEFQYGGSLFWDTGNSDLWLNPASHINQTPSLRNFYDIVDFCLYHTPAYDCSCAGSDGESEGMAAMRVSKTKTSFTVKNSKFHHICGMIHRDVYNNADNATFTFDTNEYYNAGSHSGDFDNMSTDGTKKVTFVWKNLNLHDMRAGISLKHGNTGITIQDNTIACKGDWKVGPNYTCENGIHVGDGGQTSGNASGVTIERNKVYSKTGTYLRGGIIFSDGCCTSGCIDDDTTPGCLTTANVIQNNEVYRLNATNPGQFAAAAIGVSHDYGTLTVRNNTIANGNGGIWDDTTSTTVAPAIIDNLVYNADGSASIKGLLHTRSGVSLANVKNNNLFPRSGTPYAYCSDSSCYTCTQVNSSGGSPLLSSNECVAAKLVDVTNSDVSAWNLHLSSDDTADIDKGITAATDDIDGDTRASYAPTDIGADETEKFCGSMEEACEPSWTITNNASAASGFFTPTVNFCQPLALHQGCSTSNTDYGSGCGNATISGSFVYCDPAFNLCALPCVSNTSCINAGQGTNCYHYRLGQFNDGGVIRARASIGTSSGSFENYGPHSGDTVMRASLPLHTDTSVFTASVSGLSTSCTYAIGGFYSGNIDSTDSNSIVVVVKDDAHTTCTLTQAPTVSSFTYAGGTGYTRDWMPFPACTFTPGGATVSVTLNISQNGGINDATSDAYLDDLTLTKVSCP